jgi:hypothetical protein
VLAVALAFGRDLGIRLARLALCLASASAIVLASGALRASREIARVVEPLVQLGVGAHVGFERGWRRAWIGRRSAMRI